MASKKDAYAIGRALGEEFVRENSELLVETPGMDDEVCEAWSPEEIASHTFTHYSQFSPWEFTAKEFNEARDPDGVWAAFEDGLAVGARKAARALTKEG